MSISRQLRGPAMRLEVRPPPLRRIDNRHVSDASGLRVHVEGAVKLSRRVAESAHEEQHTYRGHRFPPEIISHAVWLYTDSV